MALERSAESFPELRDALSLALSGLGPDDRVCTEAANALREALSHRSEADLRSLAAEPERLLPDFETLPEQTRRAARRAIVEADRWRVRGYALGSVHDATIRAFWWIRLAARRLQTRPDRWPATVGRVADTAAYSVRSGPAWALDTVARGFQRQAGLRAPRPTLLSLLRAAGIDPRDLVVGWAQGVPQLPAYRGYWHDPARRSTVGLVVGLDLLPGSDGFWITESNVGIALRPERSALYERDPFAAQLIAHAVEGGYRGLVVLDNNGDGIDPGMRVEYERSAREKGIDLTLVARRSLPRSHAPQMRRFDVPPLEDGVLIARIKEYSISLDHLLHNKRASMLALERYRAEVDDPALRVPRTSTEPLLGRVDEAAPFPNVVYKLPEVDAARGLLFLKARSSEHAASLVAERQRGNRTGLEDRLARLKFADPAAVYQEFVPPRLLPGRRAYIVRAHLLLTPLGHRFLSAHRVVSECAIPETLEPGIVRDPGPYVVNYSARAHYERVPADEEAEVQAAALAAARGLAWAVERAFETESRQPPDLP